MNWLSANWLLSMAYTECIPFIHLFCWSSFGLFFYEPIKSFTPYDAAISPLWFHFSLSWCFSIPQLNHAWNEYFLKAAKLSLRVLINKESTTSGSTQWSTENFQILNQKGNPTVYWKFEKRKENNKYVYWLLLLMLFGTQKVHSTSPSRFCSIDELGRPEGTAT